MSHWNYRVCKSTYKGDGYEEVTYEIREAYYNADGSIWAVTETAKGVFGDNIQEIKQCLEWMQLAVNKEVIDLDTLVFAPMDKTDTGIEEEWLDSDSDILPPS